MTKLDLFKFKDNSEKFYVLASDYAGEEFCIRELYLEGFVSPEEIRVKKDQVYVVQTPPAHWRAAFLVWKNSLLSEHTDLNFKYKDKLIELLANKYNIDLNSLRHLLAELDELE